MSNSAKSEQGHFEQRVKAATRKRALVMLVLLSIAAIGYFTVVGIGNVCGVGFGQLTLICPLGALLVLLAEKTAIPVAVISVVAALVVCLVLGKVFCAWACPVHFMSVGRQQKARLAEGKTPWGKRAGIKLDSRHMVLVAALLSTLIFGFPVFCLVCPVGLSFATVLLIMRLFAFGETTWTLLVFPAIIAAEIYLLPRWCDRICPLGALYSLLSAGNRTFVPQIDAATCIQESRGVACDLCEKSCPESINLHDYALGETGVHDCSKCLNCSAVCPVHAISFPFLPKKQASGEAVREEEVA